VHLAFPRAKENSKHSSAAIPYAEPSSFIQVSQCYNFETVAYSCISVVETHLTSNQCYAKDITKSPLALCHVT